MNTVRTRYMVNDIAETLSFYTKHLGFQVNLEIPPNPNFAMISRGNFVMVLSTPFGPGGAAKPMLDGRKAERAAGIASSSTSMTSAARLNDCARRRCVSAVTF